MLGSFFRSGPVDRFLGMFDASLCAFIVYLLGSIGYLVVDGFAMFNFEITSWVSTSLFTALASFFFLNALQYFVLWWRLSKRRPDLEMWSELV